jgi:hypothetical protein
MDIITIPSINSSISVRWIFLSLKLRDPNKSGVLDIYILGWHTCMSGNHCDNWKKWKWTIYIISESLIKCFVQGTAEYCLYAAYIDTLYINYKL